MGSLNPESIQLASPASWGGDESPRGQGRHPGASRSVWRNHTGQRSSLSPLGLLYALGPWQEDETLHTGPRVAFQSLSVPGDRATQLRHQKWNHRLMSSRSPSGSLAMNRGPKAGDLSRWAWHGQPGTSHGPENAGLEIRVLGGLPKVENYYPSLKCPAACSPPAQVLTALPEDLGSTSSIYMTSLCCL